MAESPSAASPPAHEPRRSPHTKRAALAAGAAVLALLSGGPAAAEPRQKLTVVELFTSQGCSSCPPADANLIALTRRPDVLALSFSVTYWDRLGWRDTFGKPEFTQRQYTYEPMLGERGPFTPQMVVNGRLSRVGYSLSDIEHAISAAGPVAGPEVVIGAHEVAVGPGTAPSAAADVWLAEYEPGVIEVPVRRGENAGRTLPHARVVRRLERLGGWTGTRAHYPRPEAAPGLRTAILVQAPAGGPILAAATE
ncbi:DUF1223 domain-containing protein [Xanthobacter sp. 126]|uniref:DUF1223 domain-containing protein n=1 Tax=Xanthobacter sp. 126 TaxID=1131814 RepID=UPI00045EB15A|nr:DUF1223 domain-containing protein [Xanthobacter sp. 126]